MDATLVSHAFDAGNFASAYVSTDLETAWGNYAGNGALVRDDGTDHFAGDEYRAAFVLGFYASCERHEIDDLDAYDEAAASPIGEAVFAAGYVERLTDEAN